MADEHTLLISNYRRPSCCRKYRPSFVRSKGAILVLILCFSTTFFSSLSQLIPSFYYSSSSAITNTVFFGIFAIVCLSFPFLGLLGEKWMRYKVIIIGTVILFVSYIIIIFSVAFDYLYDNLICLIIIPPAAFLYFIGLCLFEANIIQFGTDQLQFAPSEELRSFVHWICWVHAVPYLVSSLLGLTLSYKIAFIPGTIIAILIGLLPFCCFKHHLIIEPAQHNNPVKQIWRVLRYAWKHKRPVRRSAFTYGEPPPSRLDLGKERYGGPFTTEQVEDVKSFWNMIAIILFGSFAYSFQYSNSILPILNFDSGQWCTDSMSINVKYPLIIPYTVVLVAIPVHQLLIVPFFSRYIPSMLKQIWIGLIFVLLQLIALTSYHIYSTDFYNVIGNATLSSECTTELTILSQVTIISQIFGGISIIFSSIGNLGFILAQAPRTMQGILIGLWLMHYGISSLDVFVLELFLINWDFIWYYAIRTCLVLISIIIYTIAAYRYKYRQRNELSDVNERVIITQYTERRLDREEQLCTNEKEISYSIKSMAIN